MRPFRAWHSERSEESRVRKYSFHRAERDSSLRSAESHVIPAKAGIQLALVTWTPAYAAVTA